MAFTYNDLIVSYIPYHIKSVYVAIF